MSELHHHPRSRRHFLRQAGLTLAAGVGLGVAAAAPAHAAVSFTCCVNSTICTGPCQGKRKFYCYNSPGCAYCTGCRTETGCFTAIQPTCP